MLSKCLEPLTAIGCALGAGAMGLLDGGITVGAMIGGAALIARFRESAAKSGLDSTELIEGMQLAVIRQWDRADQTQDERDVIGIADAAMAKHLADCLPSREELAASSLQGSEPYPAFAARLVVDRLAQRDPIFAPDGVAALPLAREFALAAVEAALRKAKDDPAYAPLLTLDLVIAGNRVLGEVSRMQDSHGVLLDQILAAVQSRAAEQKITTVALLAIARKVVVRVDDLPQAIDVLNHSIDELLKLKQEAGRGTNLSDHVNKTLRRMADANELGKLDYGAQTGTEAFATWKEKVDETKQEGIKLTDAIIGQYKIIGNYDQMAFWICEKIKIQRDGLLSTYLIDESANFFSSNVQKTDIISLNAASILAEKSFYLAKTDEEKAFAKMCVGNALWKLGEITHGESGIRYLADSERAYKYALESFKGSQHKFSRAAMHHNIANVVRFHAERTEGEGGLRLLENAEASCRIAISIYSELSDKRDWAESQCCLAGILHAKGVRLSDNYAETSLKLSVDAYRRSLEIFSKKQDPVNWAKSNFSLSCPLIALGILSPEKDGMVYIRDAVKACRSSLLVLSKKDFEFDWAMAQHNLGCAQMLQGAKLSGKQALQFLSSALRAFKLASTVRTEQRMPIYWAMTLHETSSCMVLQAKFGPFAKRRAGLLEAKSMNESVLRVFTPSSTSFFFEKARNMSSVIRDELSALQDNESPESSI